MAAVTTACIDLFARRDCADRLDVPSSVEIDENYVAKGRCNDPHVVTAVGPRNSSLWCWDNLEKFSFSSEHTGLMAA